MAWGGQRRLCAIGRGRRGTVAQRRVLLRGRVSREHAPPSRHRISGTPSRVRSRHRQGGLSSSTVNVLWGLLNLGFGYLLVCRVGSFDLHETRHVLFLGAGTLTMPVMLARGFGRLHGGL